MFFILCIALLYGIIPFFILVLDKNIRFSKVSQILPFVLLIFVSSLYEFVFSILLEWDVSNWFIIYCFLSFLTIFYFFNRILSKKYKILKTLSLALFVILLVIIFDFNKRNFLDFCSFIDGFITIFILVFSIFWFKDVFKEFEYNSLWISPNFYFISGLILYYCGTLFLFLLSSLIYQDNKSTFQYYWFLNIILNIVLRTLIIIGIWKARVK